MYNPSPETTVAIPCKAGQEKTLVPKVNDTCFGRIPPDYLRVDKPQRFFQGNGTRRGKTGISPRLSKEIAGSYDAAGQMLNIVTYNVQDAPHGFVDSMRELQDEPFAGDVINSYNDCSPEPGQPPLGPFYELETSSLAAAPQSRPDNAARPADLRYSGHGRGAQSAGGTPPRSSPGCNQGCLFVRLSTNITSIPSVPHTAIHRRHTPVPDQNPRL